MLYLLDTTAFSLLVRRHPAAETKLSTLTDENTVLINSVVRGEVLFGLRRMTPGKRQQQYEARAAALFGEFECLPLQQADADAYSILRAACESRGQLLDDNDLWIAASAIVHEAILVTSDTDFHRIENLRLEDWS